MKLVLAVTTLAIAFLGAAALASAQDYPSRPITLIVPYAAGGGNDLMARTAAEKMSKTLGAQIVIENRGGAGGSIATRQIAKADQLLTSAVIYAVIEVTKCWFPTQEFRGRRSRSCHARMHNRSYQS